jgi:hypothetical protein
MTPATEAVPQNIWRFEVLLLASLLLDALSAMFQTMVLDMDEDFASAAVFAIAASILLFVVLVGLAARHRKNWARWILIAGFGLSVLSLSGELSLNGIQFQSLVELISAGLTAAGLYYSFTGDARGWFEISGG